jgi:tripartite-type tricarboxylate transporter receptor subunit TctC
MLAQSPCALWAPAGTPAPIIAKLNAQVTQALGAPAMKDQLRAQGVEAIPTSPAVFDRRLRVEIDQWAKVVKATGAPPEQFADRDATRARTSLVRMRARAMREIRFRQ